MVARVSNNIVIEDYTPETLAWCKEHLEFANPEYAKKQKGGYWLGNTPEKIVLYERRGRALLLPFGVLPEVFRNRRRYNHIYNLIPQPQKRTYNSVLKPYPYQEEAIKAALEARQGVIVAPCGAGKTMIGLEIAARVGGRTLWLTHTHDLLNQSLARARCLFDIPSEEFGTITEGKIDIGNTITFATVQTASKLNIPDCFDCVICDEAHHIVGSPTRLQMFWSVISSLSARYKYGLTATPKRSDGLTPCLFALLGEKVYEISRDDVADKTCPIEYRPILTGYTPNAEKIINPDGTLDYTKLINEITQDEKRNAMIADGVSRFDKPVLVLTDRVSHIKTLAEMIGKDAEGINGSTPKKKREAAIERLKSGDLPVLVASFSLAREGLDVPNLRTVVFATPQKNEAVIIQAAGRVARVADGKECGTVIDYVDGGMLASWARKRERILKKLEKN